MTPVLLAWVKSEEVFLKITEGSGDNLSDEDIDQGLNFYVLWSTFELDKDSLEIDEEMEVHLSESGELDMEKKVSLKKALPDVYEMAFSKPYSKDDIIFIKGSRRTKETLHNDTEEDSGEQD